MVTKSLLKTYSKLVICFLVQIGLSSSGAKSHYYQTELELVQLLLCFHIFIAFFPLENSVTEQCYSDGQ